MSFQTDILKENNLSSGLLERTEDTAEIDGALARLSTGCAGLLVIEGDSGSGRTSLLNHVVSRARYFSIPILSASGGAGERGVPFGVGGQLFGIPPESWRGPADSREP